MKSLYGFQRINSRSNSDYLPPQLLNMTYNENQVCSSIASFAVFSCFSRELQKRYLGLIVESLYHIKVHDNFLWCAFYHLHPLYTALLDLVFSLLMSHIFATEQVNVSTHLFKNDTPPDIHVAASQKITRTEFVQKII